MPAETSAGDLVRFRDAATGGVAVGLIVERGLYALPFTSIAEALRLPVDELWDVLDRRGEPCTALALLGPVDGRTEVWAAGVTYRRSREARIEESQASDVYTKVYEASRPELFLKAMPWKVVTDGDPIGVRHDSQLNVPEPELAVVANAHGEIVGYTVCNDVTSRSIEGANPLYLPQAKIYRSSCALAPRIRLARDLPRPLHVGISCVIEREGRVLWSASTTTAELKRDPGELLSWVFRQDTYPDGVVLSTGTGLVPDLATSLRAGDRVRIEIDLVGRLVNDVQVTTAEVPLSSRYTVPGAGGRELVGDLP